MPRHLHSYRRHMIACAIVLTAAAGLLAHVALAEEPIGFDATYNETSGRWEVSWQTGNTTRHVLDTCPAGGSLTFYWTGADGKSHTGYEASVTENYGAPNPVKLKFFVPADDEVKDYYQVIEQADGTSEVHAGNIKRDSPWAFHPLHQIGATYRIPDFAPTAGEGLTIYTAVNLDLYATDNPYGPLDGAWDVGDTLEELDLSIVDGVIAGVSGLYLATCEFEFDPNSTTGFVPVDGPSGWLDSTAFLSTHGGSIVAVGAHEQGTE